MPNSTKWAIVAGFVVSAIVWAAKQFWKVEVPLELATSGTAAITILVQHFVPDEPKV